VNHFSANRSTNHRYDLNIGQDSSIRISNCIGKRALNQFFGVALADDRHPQAALDMNNFRIRLLRAQHPVESYSQLSCRCHLRHAFRLVVMSRLQIFPPQLRIAAHRDLRRFHQQHPHKLVAMLAVPIMEAVQSCNQLGDGYCPRLSASTPFSPSVIRSSPSVLNLNT